MDPLTPPIGALHTRTAFPHDEIRQFHHTTGMPDVVAVLQPPFHGTGRAVLACAAPTTEVTEILNAQPRPPLPRRDPTRRYWPFP